MSERVLSDENIRKVAQIQDEIGIAHFPFAKPEDFDRYVELHKIVRFVEEIKKNSTGILSEAEVSR